MHFICHVQYPTISRKFSQDKTQSKKLKLNRPQRGRAPIKKPTNKKFNTLRKTIQKVKGKKKIKQKNRVRQEERETGSGIQRYLNSIIQVLSIFIYCGESKTGRKGDREAAVRRERGLLQNGETETERLERGMKVVTVKTEFQKGFHLKRLWVWAVRWN